jgi:hypothetical protein
MTVGWPARRVGKTWRTRECGSNFQVGKTGGDQKLDLPGGRSQDSRFVMRLVWISLLVSALALWPSLPFPSRQTPVLH